MNVFNNFTSTFCRFGDMTARTCLSKWLQPHFQKYRNFGEASKSLAAFFKVDSQIGQMRMLAVQKQTELMQQGKNKGIKRSISSSDTSEDIKPKTEVLQDIYNVDIKQESKEEVANSIFCQSSQGISFSSTSVPIKPVIKAEPQVTIHAAPKKKKIKLSTNKSTNFSDTTSEAQTVSKAEPVKDERTSLVQYSKRLQELLGKDKLPMMKSCIRSYKAKQSFEELGPLLNEIVMKQDEGDTILEEFKCFVMARDLSDFHLFCNVTAPQLRN